jgi:alkaline phosphatase D
MESLLDVAQRLRRRDFLIAGGAAGLTLAGPVNYVALARDRNHPIAREGKFAHGVSSGFPSPNAITLWTRVSGLDRSSRLTLEVAEDKHFHRVVESRQVTALESKDFTVHARVGGLRPGHEYHYRFQTKEKHSRVGRFRTLPPPDSKQKIKIGFYSCQSYEAGFYTAQAALAKEKDLDIVLCLGDYIYEHHYYPGPASRNDKTGKNHDGDVQSLAEYRQKYRLYQTDPNLQDLHAAYPFVSIWDDHEVEDNYAGTKPDSKQTDPDFENDGVYPRRVPFGKRRTNGYQAFFEAMPRMRHKGHPNEIYGSLRLGGLVELFLTDQRQYRDLQPCMDVQLTACPDDLLPGRTYLGSKQKAWFKNAVPNSKAKWKLWGSETMVMALDASPGNHANQDQWDGYSAEREEILSHFHDKGLENLVVLSGDIHTFIAGNLGTNGETSGDPIGTELVGGSATSLGLPEELGQSPAVLEALRGLYDPHTIFADFESRGYCVVTVSKDSVVGEFRAVGTTQQPHSPAHSLAKFKVESGTPELNQI